MLSRSLLCLAVLGASTPLLADTVWLNNGDKLSGKITLFDGGKLLIQTEYAGAVTIDWKQVKTLDSDQELLVKQDAYTGEKSRSLKAADAGKVTLANGDAPKTVELASIQQILKPKPVVEDLVWKGNVDVALDYQRAENDTDDYDIDFKTSARHGRWRHTAEGEYNREFQDDVVTTDNWRAEYSIDRFLTEQWFWQGRLVYKRDKVEDLSRQRRRRCPRARGLVALEALTAGLSAVGLATTKADTAGVAVVSATRPGRFVVTSACRHPAGSNELGEQVLEVVLGLGIAGPRQRGPQVAHLGDGFRDATGLDVVEGLALANQLDRPAVLAQRAEVRQAQLVAVVRPVCAHVLVTPGSAGVQRAADMLGLATAGERVLPVIGEDFRLAI